MFVITLLVGIACADAAKVKPDECGFPHTAVQVLQNPTRQQVAEELTTCQRTLIVLRAQIKARGYENESLVYCDQRVVGGTLP